MVNRFPFLVDSLEALIEDIPAFCSSFQDTKATEEERKADEKMKKNAMEIDETSAFAEVEGFDIELKKTMSALEKAPHS